MTLKMKHLLMQEAGEESDAGGIAPKKDVDWEALADDFDSDNDIPEADEATAEAQARASESNDPASVADPDAPVETVLPDGKQPAQEATPAVKPDDEPQEVQPTEPPVQAAQEPVVTQQEVAPTQTPPVEPPQVDHEKLREDFVAKLTDDYKLSEDDVTALIAEPETVLPKMAAQIHTRVYEDVIRTVFGSLPQHIVQVTERQRQAQDVEAKFFGAYPALQEAAKDPKKAEVIQRSIVTWKASNPQADLDTTIREAGVFAMLNLRLPLPQELLGQQAPSQSTPAPRQAYQPAAPGAAGSIATPVQKSDNPYVRLAEELLEDDEL